MANPHTYQWGETLPSLVSIPWLVNERWVGQERPAIMGILNVTPDSFFDGGQYTRPDQAILWAKKMMEAGADIIDVGGESTRPGSEEVSIQEELDRVMPVIEILIKESSIPISIDTTKAKVAEAALKLGASIVNDISAMTYEPNMLAVVLKYGCSVVLNHVQGIPRTMQVNPSYRDIINAVKSFLLSQAKLLTNKGLPKAKIALDPGIGFGKSTLHNYQLIRNIPELVREGFPVLVGLSRKSFIGNTPSLEKRDRLHPSVAAGCLSALLGASILRVHDVKETWEQLTILDAILKNGDLTRQ